MANNSVRTDYFFKEPRRFPWEIMGMSVPLAGPPHAYICKALVPYIGEEHKGFFKGSPALFELERYGEHSGLAEDIVRHCNRGLEDKISTAKIVLEFLSRNYAFRESFQKKIDKMYLDGVISIPKECEPWA